MGGNAFIGRVVSNRMQKSVVVAVSYVVWVPKYKVYEKRVARHMAHDEKQECVVGDLVKINASRKYSKHKSYRVTDVLKRMPVFSSQAAQQVIAEQEAKSKLGPVELAQQRVDAAKQRLAALKELFRKELGGSSPAAVMASLPQSSPVSAIKQSTNKTDSFQENVSSTDSNSSLAVEQSRQETDAQAHVTHDLSDGSSIAVEQDKQGTQSGKECTTHTANVSNTSSGTG